MGKVGSLINATPERKIKLKTEAERPWERSLKFIRKENHLSMVSPFPKGSKGTSTKIFNHPRR